MSRRSGNYPKELRERAVRMVAEIRSDHSSEWAAMESVASKLGIGSGRTLAVCSTRAERGDALAAVPQVLSE
jgi:transposase